MIRSFALVVIALLFCSASAAPTESSVTLLRRQAPPNVAQCASQCKPLSAAASCLQSNPSNTATCTCTAAVGSAYASCYSCIVAGGGISATAAQQTLQGVTSACSAAGMPFSNPPTISDASGAGAGSGSGSTPGATSSPSGTGAASGASSPSGTSAASSASSPSGTSSSGSSSKPSGAITTRMSYHSMAIALAGTVAVLISA